MGESFEGNTSGSWYEQPGSGGSDRSTIGQVGSDRATTGPQAAVPPPGVVPTMPQNVAFGGGEPPAGYGTHEEVDGGAKPPRRWLRIIGLAVAVLVVLAAGFMTITRVLGGGGASSPEEAVETLVKAINEQDVALAATVINPDELPMLIDLAGRVEGARERLGTGGSGPIEGTEVLIDDLEIDVDDLNDNAARITVESADFQAEVDPAKDGIPDVVADVVELSTDSDEEADTSVSETIEEVTLVAVDTGDGWYLSPIMSAIDNILVERGLEREYDVDFDDYGDAGNVDKGHDSPEEAVEELLKSIESGDPERVLDELPSGSAAPLVVYSDWLLEELRGEFPDGFNEEDFEFEDLQTTVEDGPDGTKMVRIPELRIPYYDGEVKVDGLEISDSGEESYLTSAEGKDSPFMRIVRESIDDSYYVLVREVDGGWKVDPVSTVMDMAGRLVDKIDPEVAAAVLQSTSGEPTQELTVGEPVEVEFDKNGYALLAVPTEEGALYALSVSGDSNAMLRTNGMSYNIADIYDPIIFEAEADSTKVAVSEFWEKGGEVTVTVSAIDIKDLPVGETVSGTLAAPVEVFLVSGAEADDLAFDCATVESSEVSIYSETDSSNSGLVSCDNTDWGYSEDLAEQEGDLHLILSGDVGDSYDLLLTEMTTQFNDGSTSVTVELDGDSVTTVPFTYAGDGWYIDVDGPYWADIDGELYIDSYFEDESDDSGSDFQFVLPYEGGGGEVKLWIYSSDSFGTGSSESVTLELLRD